MKRISFRFPTSIRDIMVLWKEYTRITDNDIEYVRKDAFVEKAYAWLEENLSEYCDGEDIEYTPSSTYNVTILQNERMIEDFKKYMKGKYGMEQYIPKSTLVAEIDKKIYYFKDYEDRTVRNIACNILNKIKQDINTLEVKEVDLGLITGWFDHVAQIADDRMTLTGQRMTDAHALDEIKCIAKNSSEFITKHYKAQEGE